MLCKRENFIKCLILLFACCSSFKQIQKINKYIFIIKIYVSSNMQRKNTSNFIKVFIRCHMFCLQEIILINSFLLIKITFWDSIFPFFKVSRIFKIENFPDFIIVASRPPFLTCFCCYMITVMIIIHLDGMIKLVLSRLTRRLINQWDPSSFSRWVFVQRVIDSIVQC